MIFGPNSSKGARKPAIMTDATHWILNQSSKEVTGNFFLDDEVLTGAGTTDMDQ